MTGRLRPSIISWEMRPPEGGWSIVYEERGRKHQCVGTPGQIVAKIAEIKVNLGTFVSEVEIWDYCNAIWCARDPKRCIGRRPDPEPEPIQVEIESKDPREISPTIYGPGVWFWLNTFGMTGQFDKSRWEDTIDRILQMFDPSRSKYTSSEECYLQLRQYVDANEPKDTETAAQAARWVFTLHNQVNKRLGKPRLLWAEAVCQFGWDVDLPKK